MPGVIGVAGKAVTENSLGSVLSGFLKEIGVERHMLMKGFLERTNAPNCRQEANQFAVSNRPSLQQNDAKHGLHVV